MHNNYFFLQLISKQLDNKLSNSKLLACFSQSKDELILGFSKEKEDFYIKASLTPSFCCLFFPDTFHRSRKNSVDLFKEIIDLTVIQVRQYKNERCFALEFEQDYSLLFKMYGNRSNIVLFKENGYVAMFKNNLLQDKDINLALLDRTLDQSLQALEAHNGNYTPLFPTFGPVAKHYLKSLGYEDMPIDKKWQTLQQLLQAFQNPKFHIIEINDTIHFSLVATGKVLHSFDAPIEALNHFFIFYSKEGFIKKEKKVWLGTLHKSLKQTHNYINKSSKKLHDIENSISYEILANILMANLYNVPKGASEVELDNFYDGSKVKIKLKTSLSPQKNAALFYKKAKNQKIEIDKLKETISHKTDQATELESQINFVESCDDVKQLKAWVKENKLQARSNKQEAPLPYHQFEYNGFDIWVGKNARANDELTLKHAWKEDLWLHAKDVSGSHVVLKYQAGKNFPKNVIEKAAQLAAYYSKRKQDSLCPVIATKKKFVRKRKGDPAGAVVVEKEEVVLVKPEKWN